MRLDKKSGLSDAGVTECQQQKIQEILDLSELSDEAESSRTESFLTALHLIISALDGEKLFFLFSCGSFKYS